MQPTNQVIAQALLEVEAVKLSPSAPFTWASGWFSPIYCDNRVTLSYPAIRATIANALTALVQELYPQATAIAGVATGAIAQGVLVAERLQLPFSYVRPKAKDHGMRNQIEGQIAPNAKVVVVEDLISTGGSSLVAAQALRAEGYEVLGMVAIYTHGFPHATQAFAEAQLPLHTLTEYGVVVEAALKCGYITEEQLATLKEWRKSPHTWGKE